MGRLWMKSFFLVPSISLTSVVILDLATVPSIVPRRFIVDSVVKWMGVQSFVFLWKFSSSYFKNF